MIVKCEISLLCWLFKYYNINIITAFLRSIQRNHMIVKCEISLLCWLFNYYNRVPNIIIIQQRNQIMCFYNLT